MSAQVDVLGYFDDLIRNGEEHHEPEARKSRAAVAALIAERDALREALQEMLDADPENTLWVLAAVGQARAALALTTGESA